MSIVIIFLACLVIGNATYFSIKTSVRQNRTHALEFFWRNTGLCPTADSDSREKFLLSYDEKVNLVLIGSLPHLAITHVRIHWLLDLVTVKDGLSADRPVFEFSQLDQLIDNLFRYGLAPGFELMGNPSNYFFDFGLQAEDWTLLLRQILARYTGKYGSDYVNTWRFELMNEPDLKMYNTMNLTLPKYLQYFLESSKLIKNLHGPAGLFRSNKAAHPLCWGFLDYCNSNACRLETLTFHRKGNGTGSQVVKGSLDLITDIYSTYRNLSGISVGNDEADILTGWQKPVEWRADVRYAALMLQVIMGHIQEIRMKRNIPFTLLSNDNAFLSYSPHYFTQRTLLARFQMNNTEPKHVQFFKKPVYSAMAMLSLLGTELTGIRYRPGEPGISFMTTKDESRVALLVAVTNDTVGNITYESVRPANVNIRINMKLESTGRNGRGVVYVMDNTVSNPHQAWKEGGSLDFPGKSLRRMMRKGEGFFRLAVSEIDSNSTRFRYELKNGTNPCVLIVNICYTNENRLGRATNLHYVNVTHNEIILIWSDVDVNSKCLLTYAVEFKPVTDSTFHRINDVDTLFLSYHFDGTIPGSDGEAGVAGDYRVTPIDYWNRTGPPSNIIHVF